MAAQWGDCFMKKQQEADAAVMVDDEMRRFRDVRGWQWAYRPEWGMVFMRVTMIDGIEIEIRVSDYMLEYYLGRSEKNADLRTLLYREIAAGLDIKLERRDD